MTISSLLESWCSENQLTISPEQLQHFEAYASLLVSWNEKMNLTAITDPKEIAVKHFIDSISLLTCCNLPADARLMDIGTGAGFPGIPLKIMRPDLRLTLLDSLNKRLIFLNEVCKDLGLEAELLHARAEEFGQKPEYREQYDIVVSRAVANLPALCEFCLPYVKVGGSFISMKGPDGEHELSLAAHAISQLGGKLQSLQTLRLPDESVRMIISIQKISPAPSKYPRRGVKISKSPL